MNNEDKEIQRALEEFERQNYPVALQLLRPLARDGNPRAQICLANIYHLGLGVAADGQRAVELYLSVAQKNITEWDLSALAYNNLGSLYMAGGPKLHANRELATKYFAMAKALGFPSP